LPVLWHTRRPGTASAESIACTVSVLASNAASGLFEPARPPLVGWAQVDILDLGGIGRQQLRLEGRAGFHAQHAFGGAHHRYRLPAHARGEDRRKAGDDPRTRRRRALRQAQQDGNLIRRVTRTDQLFERRVHASDPEMQKPLSRAKPG
jgi:hypothetical protein